MNAIRYTTRKFNLLFGFRHNFNVETIYLNKKGEQVFERYTLVECADKRLILNFRLLKRIIHNDFDASELCEYDRNGKIVIGNISYLGYFKK